ncbi:MAG: CoxG family protein [Thermaurantiacus sp.]
MELKGEVRIAAEREKVWQALNDPEVLARSIDGVERLEASGENRFEGSMKAKVGPVRATFKGVVELSNIDPPNGYTLSGEGSGGVAGFAKGSADIGLEDTGDGATLLRYAVQSQVGGKLAQLGSRLVEGAARSYAESFFTNFRAIVEGPADAAPASPAPAAPESAREDVETMLADEERSGGIPPLVWAGVLAIVILLLVAWLLRG